jgi:hypothetical protein
MQKDLRTARQQLDGAVTGAASDRMLEMQGALKQAVKDYDLLLQELGNVRNDSRKKSGVIDVLQARLSKAGEEQQSQQCALLSFLPSLTLFLSISAREHLYAQAKGPSHCCICALWPVHSRFRNGENIRKKSAMISRCVLA